MNETHEIAHPAAAAQTQGRGNRSETMQSVVPSEPGHHPPRHTSPPHREVERMLRHNHQLQTQIDRALAAL